MANEFLLSEYADLAALKAQSDAIIASFDKIEARAQVVGDAIKKNISGFGDATGLQAILTGLQTTDAATKVYATTIKGLGDDVKTLTELQKVQAAAQAIAIKQAQIDLIELKKRNQELTIAAKEQLVADKAIAQAAKEKTAADKLAAAESVAAGRERIIQLRQEQAQIEKLEEAERQRATAEQAAMSGTYNPGGGKGNTPSQGFTPQALSVMQGNILLVKQYQSAIANLTTEQKNDFAAFKKGEISQAEYQQRIVLATEKINTYRVGVSALNREMKLSSAVNDAERNSLQRAQALILQYTNEKKQLNLATADGVRLNQNYNKAIASTNAFILKNADGETQRVKNIGNYSSALNGYVSVLRGMRGPTKLLGEALGIGAQEADQLRLIIEHSLQGVAAYIRGKKASTAAMEADSIATGGNITAKEAAAAADAQLAEANLALSTATAATTAAEAQLAETQVALLASTEAEALAVAELSTVMAANTVLTAAETLAQDQLLIAQSAAAAAATAEATAQIQLTAAQQINIIATAEQAAAQAALAAATGASTVAMRIFSAAMKFTGIGLLIAAIVLIAMNFRKFKESLGVATEAQKLYNETLDEYKKGAAEAITKTEKVKLAFDEAKQGVISKEKALKIYNDTLGETLGAATSLTQAEDLYTKKADVYIKIMGLKAQANALFAKSGEELAKQTTASQENNVGFKGWLQTITSGIISTKAGVKALSEAQIEGTKELIKDSQFNGKSLEEAAKKLAIEAQKLQNAFGIGDEGADKGQKTKKSTTKESTKSQLDSDFELYKIAQLEKIKLLEEEVKNEKLSYAIRLTDLTQYSKAKIELIDRAAADSLRKEEDKEAVLQDNLKSARGNAAKNILIDLANTQTKIKQIKSQQAVDLREVERDNAKQMEEITKQQNEAYLKTQKANYDRALQFIEEKHYKEKEQNTIAYTESLESLQKNFDLGLISQREFIKRKEQLEFDNAIASINIEIAKTKAIIALRALLGQDVSKELSAIADLEKSIARDTLKHFKDINKEKLNNVKDTLDSIQSYSEKAFGIIDGVMNAGATKQKNELKAQSDAAEAKAQRDIEIVNASSLSEQDKAAKIIVINARLAAQKEAIAKKQKEADLQAAQFNKAKAEFNIILSTAQAVMAALSENNPAAAIAAGVIGAAELAVAIATPIPKFKTGLEQDYEGYGIVGDGGRSEAIIRKDGSIEITPDTDTLTYINKGDRILPDLKLLQNIAMSDNMGRQSKGSNLSALLVQSMAQSESQQRINQQLLSSIANKREVHLSATEGALVSVWKLGANRSTYTDEQCNW